MALDTTWYSALVDSDGTPGNGSVWAKTDVNSLMSLINDLCQPTVQTTTATGTQQNFALNTRFTYLRCANASPLTFGGFVTPGVGNRDGDRLIIDNLSSSTVRVTNEDTGSTAANRNGTPSINGQIIGNKGRILGVYDVTSGRWRMTVLDPGAWIPVTFAAGDFTASGSMTWTVAAGDVVTHAYKQHGKALTVAAFVQTTTVGGTPSTQLKVAIPAGFVATRRIRNGSSWINDNGTGRSGFVDVPSVGATVLDVWRTDLANFTASTDNTTVTINVELEVD